MQKKFPYWDADFCRRGVGQLEGFLLACSTTTEQLAPSEVVDEFWHAFVLRTVPYAEFCDNMAGRFIHHLPADDEMPVPDGGGQAAHAMHGNAIRARAIEAITAAGYHIDNEFWPELAPGDCTQCYQGCTDSPKN